MQLLHLVVLLAVLLDVDMLALTEIAHHSFELGVWLVALRKVQFCERLDDQGVGGRVFVSDVGLQTEFMNNLINFFLIRNIGTVLAHYPGNHLHERLWDVWILLKDLEINFDCAFAEFFSVLLLVVLPNTFDEFVGEVLSDKVAPELKNFVHRSNVPVLGRRELFSELINFDNQVFSG